jgi:hypothetical protein
MTSTSTWTEEIGSLTALASALYYRGGIHDWVTLGLPLAPAAEEPAR